MSLNVSLDVITLDEDAGIFRFEVLGQPSHQYVLKKRKVTELPYSDWYNAGTFLTDSEGFKAFQVTQPERNDIFEVYVQGLTDSTELSNTVTYTVNSVPQIPGTSCLLMAVGVPVIALNFIRAFRGHLPLWFVKGYYSLSVFVLHKG